MARREDVVNSIYDDLDHLSNDALAVYIWSWTNKSCGMAGIYKIPKRKIYEGRLDADTLDAALAELDAEGLLFYEQNVLWVKGRIKRLSHVNEPIGKSIARDLNDLKPDHPLLVRLVDKYSEVDRIWSKVEEHLNFTRTSLEVQDVPSDSQESNYTRTTPEVQPNYKGRGSGSGSGGGSGSDFEEWLGDYRVVTGRESIRGSKPARTAFDARIKDGYSLDDLKLATRGCHGDQFCRDNGHDVPETILRASKIERYIALAKQGPRSPSAPGMTQAEQRAEQIKRKREARAVA